MQAAMPTSSITPYMWSVSGPALKTPLEGDGMYARTAALTAAILPLDQDADREVRRAAALEQAERVVEVDVGAGGELERREVAVAGPLEGLRAPALHALRFRLDDLVNRRHHALHSRRSFIRKNARAGSPHSG